MQVVVNSLITAYNRVGKGKPLVLLHGWGDSLATFSTIEPKLAQNFEVISLDLPGFGQTQGPEQVWGLEEYASFVRDFQAKIGLKEVYAYIGHSNGAAVLICGIGKGTLKSDKLVLVAAAGVRTNQKAKRTAFKVIAKVGKVATFFLPVETKAKLRKKLYGAAGSDMLVVPQLQETFKKTVRQDVQAEAAKITIPTLLIYGSNDKATPLADGQRLQGLIKDSVLKTVEGASHYVHQEHPETILKYVGEFLT
jgi:pimeloyl-ACP methyl ester carboxylesterase